MDDAGPGHAGGRRRQGTGYNPFDLTKVWPHGDYPLDRGRRARAQPQSRELFRRDRAGGACRRRTSFRASATRPTRCCRRASSPTPTRIVTGSARTTKRCRSTRRGARSITITRMARCGSSATITGNPDAYYEPNSFGGPPRSAAIAEPPLHISGDADRYNHRDGNDDYTPARQPLPPDERRAAAVALMDNIAAAMQGVPVEIVRRQVGAFLPMRSRLRHRRRDPHEPHRHRSTDSGRINPATTRARWRTAGQQPL